MYSKYFSREEFEKAIYKCLGHGDEKDLAGATDAGYSILCQKMSPDNERESDLFRAAAVLAAWLEMDPVGGECALTRFEQFIRRAKHTPLQLDLPTARRRSHKERSDFHIAEAENKPLSDRIHELTESIEADTELLESLKAEEQRLKQREAFPGAAVSHTARAIGARVVGGRRG